MRMPALAIFDCDGVLVDSEHLTRRILHAMLLAEGVAISYEDTVGRFLGHSITCYLDGVSALFGGSRSEGFSSRFKEQTLAAFATCLTAVPGILVVLSSLAVPYCVASNGRHAKKRKTLDKSGLLHRFSQRIFPTEDVDKPKPAPDLFLHAARSLGAKPQDCVVVEDSPTGIEAARAAGMRALGFSALTMDSRLRAAGAHAVFRDMGELSALLRFPA